MRVPLFLIFVVFATSVFGQTTTDSLTISKEVDSLLQVSTKLLQQRKFDKALDVIATAENLVLEKWGPKSDMYRICCAKRGWVLFRSSKFVEADKWLNEAKNLLENAPGKERDYAEILIQIGWLYKAQGKYAEAEKSLLESKNILEKLGLKESASYSTMLVYLATIYRITRNYDSAELFNLEAIAIDEKVFGCEHSNYANDLNSLANLYFVMGAYEKAIPLYQKAKTIWEKLYGKEDPNYSMSLNNLAAVYYEMGYFEKSEPFFLESMAIQLKANGKENPDCVLSLYNLAGLYCVMGNYKRSEALFLEAKDIREKVLGKEHPDYAITLDGLADLYHLMGDIEREEMYRLESIAILEKSVGKKSMEYAMALGNLGTLYLTLGKIQKAEALVLESKAILEGINAKDNQIYGVSLALLANIYVELGIYENAEALLHEDQVLFEEVLGKETIEYIDFLGLVVNLYEKANKFVASELLLAEKYELEQKRILKSANFLSERELANYTATFQTSGDNLSSYLLARPSGQSGNLPGQGYDHTLFYKGFLLTSAAKLNTPPAARPEIVEINNRLKGYRRQLAAEYTKPMAEQKRLAELEEKANTVEKELARMVAGYTEATRQVNWQEVQSTLKPHEAAIEFIRFQVNFPKKTDSTMYAALVLLPAEALAKEGLPGERQPEFIPLFEEESLNSILASSSARKADYVNAVYGFKTETNNPRAQKSLYELLWKPLEKYLAGSPAVDLSKAGIKTIYFSPSGLLHRLNLNAIPINNKETLSDRYHLVEMGSTRQLVFSPESNRSTPDAGQALLFGGVQYDLNSDSIASQNIDLESNITGTRGDLNFSYTDSTDRGGTWNYLKWTDKEVTALEPILKSAQIQTTLRKGYTATEEAFKSIGSNGKSPRILHIATHGYFFPDPKETTKGSASGLGAEPVFKLSDHPMIRSGLILAGGNHAWKTGKPLKPGMEDGILTAYEISQMDLSNTELVVLSACETGLGDIQGNEGVYGLQRAFKIAGAKYLIMSLWQVPDFQTQELMTTFYTNWLTKKQPIPEAFRAAQQTMREKYEHPYFWAGFVLVE